MRVTNRNNLPQPLVNVLKNDTYSKGAARISITGLMTPPRIAMLRQKHHDLIEEDVSDNIWAILGRAVHAVLEAGADEEHLSEERLFAEVDGWVISGALDLQHLGKDGVTSKPKIGITDYKMTSAWAVMQEKQEWEDQLNSYKFLVEEAKDWQVERLDICAIIRDWSRHKAAQDPNYPQEPVVRVPIRMWPHAHAKAYVLERIKHHRDAIAAVAFGDELPLCTDEERWMRPGTWAVVRKGNEHKQSAIDMAAEKGLIIEERKAEPIRCTTYCKVSAWCSQYAAWKKESGYDR